MSDCPLRTSKIQRANDRAAFRLQLVTAMLGSPMVDDWDTTALIESADAIIDALEARRNEEANGN